MVKEHEGVKYLFFWGGWFSNWAPTEFTVNGVKYNCGEQYMMAEKARVFEDYDIMNQIFNETSPMTQKALGRKVKNFDPQKWGVVKYDIVKKGLREKFIQHPESKQYLLEHNDCVIVEASTEDRIWGIGYHESNALENIENWGENLLGKIITELTKEIE